MYSRLFSLHSEVTVKASINLLTPEDRKKGCEQFSVLQTTHVSSFTAAYEMVLLKLRIFTHTILHL